MSSFQKKWGMLVVLSLALAVIILDTTILNVALSSIIKDLNTDIQSVQWVITIYSLVLAALTITGGRMGDIFGKKRMFVLGAILFAAGSFLASVSTNVTMLIVGEAIIEGIGAAMMMPATASLLVENFFGHERAIAFGIWGGIAGASAALGPILGGFLATNYSWRWGFRVNLIVVSLLVLGSILIPKSEKKEQKMELDLVGVVLSALGMLSLVFGIIESSTYGWWSAKQAFVAFDQTITIPWDLSVVPAFLLVGAGILAAFFFWERKHEANGHTPLVSTSIFKNRTFTGGIATTSVMALGQTGLIFAVPVFLQSVRSLDAFHTGLSLLPMSLSLLVFAPISAVLGKKISARALIALGLLIDCVAYVVLYQSLTPDSSANDLAVGLGLFGVGMGLVMSQINNITLSAVPKEQAGEASGLNNTVRQVGATLGSAIMGAVLIGALGARMTDGVSASTVIPDDMKTVIAQTIASQTSNVEFGGGAHFDAAIPQPIVEEITRISHQATTDATKKTLAYGGVFALLGFLVALVTLPGKKRDEKTDEGAIASLGQSANTPWASVVKQDAPFYDLTPSLIRDLIDRDLELQKTGRSLGVAIRAIIDASLVYESPMMVIDPLMVHARKLWDLGVGTALGFATFEEYARSLPAVPHTLHAHHDDFPHLVLVDARVAPRKLLGLMRISIGGSTATVLQKSLDETGNVYWIRVNHGAHHVGKSVADAQVSMKNIERGMTISEAIIATMHAPNIINDRYIDCAKDSHEGFENSVATIGKWGGKVQLRYRWRDHADARCGVAVALLV